MSNISGAESGFLRGNSYCFHSIDLRPELKAVYRGFHESCIRRKIKRAEKEELVYESGRSQDLLQKFRKLLFLTRRRHRLPPQPASWFQNIVDCLGETVTIHMASKDSVPVASIVTLLHKKTLVYKYGCSDGQFSNMGGTPFLFWRAIQQAKELGIEKFDLGRSDHDEPGLIAFKEHLGASPSQLTYYRDPGMPIKKESSKSSTSASSFAREALIRLPDPLLGGVGELLYRHMG
jgi:lipid II:glycine glycyltransferase (peptidoglycan interpeptide bridge formation enzyme)